MLSSLPTLLSRIESREIRRCDVIEWGCPVPVFGNIKRSRVATLGINPSNLEFLDHAGNELSGASRRFHTLRSLEIPSWTSADSDHIRFILDSFDEYFGRNPYDRWFSKLDKLLSTAGATYYKARDQLELPLLDASSVACHLDLVPFATRQKWTDLNGTQRDTLLTFGANCLGQLLRDSQIEHLVCNGQSVVRQLEFVTSTELHCNHYEAASLPNEKSPRVKGFVYEGRIGRVGDVDLGREVTVLGFNHNLQSSFGVTNGAILALSNWVASRISGAKQ